MIIDTKAPALLSAIQFLSKISKRNESFLAKNIMIDADKDTKMYAYSSDIYGQLILDAGVSEKGKFILPITIIPYLQSIGDTSIKLEVTLDKIKLLYRKSIINLAQVAGNVGEFSKREQVPQWTGVDLAKLKDIKYASDTAYGFDVFWFVNKAIIASNKIKVAIYKPRDMPDVNLTIPNYVTSFIPDNDIVDLAINHDINSLWFGTDKTNISIQFNTVTPCPKALLDLSEDPDFSNFVMVNKEALLREVTNAANIATEENPGCSILITDDIKLTAKSNLGDTDLSVGILDGTNLSRPIDVKVDAKYLKQIISNSSGPQIILGTRNLNGFELLMVHDYDITNYLVPRVN